MKMDSDSLISLVFSKPPVWDKRNKNHSNRYVVDKCWREISTEMNEDENKLRKKWKYLRDQFSIEYGKIPVRRSNSTSYEPKWRYYRSLLFLKDIVRARKASGNLSQSLRRPSSSTSVEQTNDLYDSQDNSNSYQDDSDDPLIEASDVQYDTNSCGVLEENSTDTNTNIDFTRVNNAVPRIKTANTLNQNLLEIEKKKLEYLQQKARKYEDDEHLLFMKSLLPHIRKIPQERLLSFRNDIQRTVDIYAYQSQFSRPSPSTFCSYSPEQYTVQSVTPTITCQTSETHATESVAPIIHSTPISRHTSIVKEEQSP